MVSVWQGINVPGTQEQREGKDGQRRGCRERQVLDFILGAGGQTMVGSQAEKGQVTAGLRKCCLWMWLLPSVPTLCLALSPHLCVVPESQT